jgi:hypothetical protein
MDGKVPIFNPALAYYCQPSLSMWHPVSRPTYLDFPLPIVDDAFAVDKCLDGWVALDPVGGADVLVLITVDCAPPDKTLQTSGTTGHDCPHGKIILL